MIEPYAEWPGIGTLYCGDCASILREFEPGSVDAVITSPPYNLGAGPWPHLGNWRPGHASSGGKGLSKWRNGSDASHGIQYNGHRDSMPWSEYVSWQQDILGRLWELIRDDGVIFYNHKPRVIGAKLWLPTELIPSPIVVRQIVIWSRPGGLNYTEVALVPTHEWVMLLAKEGFRLKSKEVSGLGDVWRMTPADMPDHPAPFPIELPLNCLELVNSETEMILDPFAGSGTVGVACVQTGRRFVLCEISEAYCEIARKRIDRELSQPRLPFAEPVKETQSEMFAP